jgi:molybdenum cofactor cytidylyltransferase
MIHLFGQNDTTAIASVYAAKRGTPAIFPRQAFPELLTLQGDKGARGLLSHSDRKVIDIAFEGGELDIDRPDDLLQL